MLADPASKLMLHSGCSTRGHFIVSMRLLMVPIWLEVCPLERGVAPIWDCLCSTVSRRYVWLLLSVFAYLDV